MSHPIVTWSAHKAHEARPPTWSSSIARSKVSRTRCAIDEQQYDVGVGSTSVLCWLGMRSFGTGTLQLIRHPTLASIIVVPRAPYRQLHIDDYRLVIGNRRFASDPRT